MGLEVVKFDGDRGEYRVTRNALYSIPLESRRTIDEWWDCVVQANRHMVIQAHAEYPSGDLIITWESKALHRPTY